MKWSKVIFKRLILDCECCRKEHKAFWEGSLLSWVSRITHCAFQAFSSVGRHTAEDVLDATYCK